MNPGGAGESGYSIRIKYTSGVVPHETSLTLTLGTVSHCDTAPLKTIIDAREGQIPPGGTLCTVFFWGATAQRSVQDLSCSTRDGTRAFCSGSAES